MFIKSAVAAALLLEIASAQQSQWGQCGGNGWTGPTSCSSGNTCSTLNPYYAQCIPGSAKTTTTAYQQTTARTTTTTTAPNQQRTTTTTTPAQQRTTTTTAAAQQTSVSCSSNSPPSSAGSVRFGGVNIAGYDFGCGTDGTCTGKNVAPPTSQFSHFRNDGFNIFRLPIGWQSVTPTLGGSLGGQFSSYDSTMQSCLNSGAYCILDIHNYARWNGAIIGQGGPTNAQFASLWSQLAAHYASQSKVIFGVMNEPHDLDVPTWAVSVQAAVTAIRQAGATSQMILLPGTGYTGAGTFVSSGSADALGAITNPDGSKTNLIFDVHKYLDSDNSGTSTTCVTDNVSSAFQPLSYYLRCHGRQALLSETGGGNNAGCVTYMNSELAFLNKNSDVYLGFVGWAAGAFDSTYALTLTPASDGTDTQLLAQAFKPSFHGSG